uniref:Zinc finger, CCHC-type n=1 Tax=Tanacetum cinerariifolium TaxID=118510 RepID=A0A6L2K3L0_TANCI|nr:zinc finger, CCHC-type [Tanacetum cinerariifolium]
MKKPRDFSNLKCYNCNEYGHYASHCRKRDQRQQRREASNLVEEDLEPTLLMTSTSFNKTQRKSSKDTPTNKSIWFAKDYDNEDSKFGEIILEKDKEGHDQDYDRLKNVCWLDVLFLAGLIIHNKMNTFSCCRIIVKIKLKHHIPVAPVAPPGQQVPSEALTAHAAWVKGKKEVAVIMLLTMDQEIQRNLAHLSAYDMLQELKAMYSKQAEHKLLQTVREFYTSKQEEELQTVNELHAMLKLHEEMLPKKDVNPALHAIRARRVQKNQKNKSPKARKGSHGKCKGKMANASNNVSFASKPKTTPPPKKDNPTKDAICHQCVKVGHWRRNCPVYLAKLTKKKKLS